MIASENIWSKLWDWNNYRLLNYTIKNNSLCLTLWYIKYRNVYSPPYLVKNILKNNEKDYWNWLFAVGLIKTHDDYFVLGVKSWKYLRKGWTIALIWWALQPDDIKIHTIEDCYSWFLKECNEEIWLKKIPLKAINLFDYSKLDDLMSVCCFILKQGKIKIVY